MPVADPQQTLSSEYQRLLRIGFCPTGGTFALPPTAGRDLIDPNGNRLLLSADPYPPEFEGSKVPLLPVGSVGASWNVFDLPLGARPLRLHLTHFSYQQAYRGHVQRAILEVCRCAFDQLGPRGRLRIDQLALVPTDYEGKIEVADVIDDDRLVVLPGSADGAHAEEFDW